MGRGESVVGGHGMRRAGASGRGHDGAVVRLRGRGERMGIGLGQASGRACQACRWASDEIHPHQTSVR
jgi:hypothetical protein